MAKKTKTDQEIRDEIRSQNKNQERMLLMIWDELLEIKYALIHSNSFAPEQLAELQENLPPNKPL